MTPIPPRPDATDAQFADGYARAVTFGMLMARARQIELSADPEHVARLPGRTNSLIGAALRPTVAAGTAAFTVGQGKRRRAGGR